LETALPISVARELKSSPNCGLSEVSSLYFFLPARLAAQYFFIRSDTALR
jgi:hypothetical protein